jgi:hypothetical protein
MKKLSPSSVVSSKAQTSDGGKCPLGDVPWAGVRAMSMAQAFGRDKYGDINDFRKGMEVRRNASCAIRHISDFLEREDFDPESGVHHLGHAMARLAFILQNLKDGTGVDDRPKVSERREEVAQAAGGAYAMLWKAKPETPAATQPAKKKRAKA